MKRNIDILVEIQRRIYKFKFTYDDISVAIDVNDAELFDLIKDGDKRVIDIMNTIADIAQNLGLLTEDIKASMLNEGFDIDEYNEWTSSLMYNQYNLEGMLETIENALEVLEVYRFSIYIKTVRTMLVNVRFNFFKRFADMFFKIIK